VGDLRVIICVEGDNEWYAQGLEIDYLAQGTSLEDVQDAFERGLKETISEHLKDSGDIRKLLTPAPADVWTDFYDLVSSDLYSHSQMNFYSTETETEDGAMVKRLPAAIPPRPLDVPFQKLSYYTPRLLSVDAPLGV